MPLAAEHTTFSTDPFSPRRPPTTDAPMAPPARFVRRTNGRSKPLAPRITLHYCDDVPDDAELQLRIDELKKFIVLWEGSVVMEEEEDIDSKNNRKNQPPTSVVVLMPS
jgi:hypothetical protein